MVYVCRKDNNACHVTYRESSPVLSPPRTLIYFKHVYGGGVGA